MCIPYSSRNSRTMLSSSRSPNSRLPPGNSQVPASFRAAGPRWARKNREPGRATMAPTPTPIWSRPGTRIGPPGLSLDLRDDEHLAADPYRDGDGVDDDDHVRLVRADEVWQHREARDDGGQDEQAGHSGAGRAG